MSAGTCYEGLCCLWQQLEEDLKRNTVVEGWLALRESEFGLVEVDTEGWPGLHYTCRIPEPHICRLVQLTLQNFMLAYTASLTAL